MPITKKLYDKWQAQPDNQTRNRLLADALGVDYTVIGEIPEYCDNLAAADKAILQAWGSIEEETAPRYTCLESETADEGRKKCLVEWWPDDDTHIVTPRFSTEAEAKAFAAYLFATLESA